MVDQKITDHKRGKTRKKSKTNEYCNPVVVNDETGGRVTGTIENEDDSWTE